jgi:hypothetical protein
MHVFFSAVNIYSKIMKIRHIQVRRFVSKPYFSTKSPPTYSYEIRSWLLQGMRDAIVSGSGYYQLLMCTTCPENIGRVSWFSIIEF